MLLVVICHSDIDWTVRSPAKTDTVLVVDPNAVLPFTITVQRLETIARRHPKILKQRSAVQQKKFPTSNPTQSRGESLTSALRNAAIEQVLGTNIMKAADHRSSSQHTASENMMG